MRFEHHHYYHDPKTEAYFRAVERKLCLVLETQEEIMNTTKDALAAVTAARSRIDSLIALSAAQKAQLDKVLVGVLTPEQQADVDAIFDLGNKEAADIDTALNTGVPAPVLA